MLRNSPEFVLAYLASVAAGAIVVPLHDRYGPKEVLDLVEACGVSRLITAEPFRPLCERARCALVLTEEWGDLDRDSHWSPPAVDPNAPVMYQFSSGSTGRPKRIARTHRQLLFELDSLAETIGLGPDDRFLGAAPFSHVNGLMRTMLSKIASTITSASFLVISTTRETSSIRSALVMFHPSPIQPVPESIA
jgi:long-chain acyl-CoA synthetase